MPSPRHDALNKMFRDRPEFALEVLRDLKGVDIPATSPARVESNDFNDRPSKDFTPDTVISAGAPQQLFHGVIVEIQEEPSDTKRSQLPRYAAALWLMLRCRVTVLCVCLNPRTAKYFADPIPTDLPGYTLPVQVLGPHDIPVFTDHKDAAAHPELAVLSMLVHRERKTARAFVDSLHLLPPGHATQYYEHGFGMAPPAVRRDLEELMASTTWPVNSPFAKEHFGRGLREGEVKGKAEGEAKSVLLFLAARGIHVPDDIRDRINGCTDTDQLEHWIQRAAVINDVHELFD